MRPFRAPAANGRGEEIVALDTWGGHGRRAGWMALFDPETWLRAFVFVVIGVILMAVLACAVALVRDTRGHDWYATGKLTLAELLIETDFDERAPTEYRKADGTTLTVTRDDLRFNGDALLARGHLLRTAVEAIELGAWCGFGGALLCLVLFRRPEPVQPIRRAPLPTITTPESTPRKLPAGPDPRPPPKAKPKRAPARAPETSRAPARPKRTARAGRWF